MTLLRFMRRLACAALVLTQIGASCGPTVLDSVTPGEGDVVTTFEFLVEVDLGPAADPATLEVELNGVNVKMKPGDKLLIERGARHAFRSVSGAIFAEISTTHHVGDSYYDDSAISKLDPMQRKTILESW